MNGETSDVGVGAGKEISFYFHFYIIFWIVLNFLFMDMHVSYYKLNQACEGCGRELCVKRFGACATEYCIKTEPDVKQRMSVRTAHKTRQCGKSPASVCL